MLQAYVYWADTKLHLLSRNVTILQVKSYYLGSLSQTIQLQSENTITSLMNRNTGSKLHR